MLTIGLTGGIASGKSTVSKMLAERGCAIIEADAIAHECLAPGHPIAREIVREFGASILDEAGAISRPKLGQIVFADPAKLARLNALTHPWTLHKIAGILKDLSQSEVAQIAVVIAALHIETGYYESFDRLAVAWCRPEQQLERLLARGCSIEDAQRRIASQMPIEAKRKLADDLIDCSGALEDTRRQVNELAAKWKEMARPPK